LEKPHQIKMRKETKTQSGGLGGKGRTRKSHSNPKKVKKEPSPARKKRAQKLGGARTSPRRKEDYGGGEGGQEKITGPAN